MTDLHWLTAIVWAHIGHSLALSLVLAITLLLSKRLSGAARYALCSFALAGAIALPMVALNPGSSFANQFLETVDAPVTFSGLKGSGIGPVDAPPEQTTSIGRLGEIRAEIEPPRARSEVLSPAVSTQTPAQSLQSEGEAITNPAWASTTVTSAVASLAEAWAGLPDFTLFLALAWAVGSIVLLAKIACDLLSSVKMVRNSRQIQLPPKLARQFAGVRIAVSDDTPGPIAAGIIRPSILLPADFERQLDRPGVAALLEHERAHVERQDMLVALIQRIALAVFWWSPALHWISQRMDEEREVACDEVAVERTGDAHAFALTLTDQAEIQLGARTPRLAVAAIGGRSQFGRRIGRLIAAARSGGGAGNSQDQSSARIAFTGLAAVALAGVLLTPGVQAREQSADQASARAAKETSAIVLARTQQTLPPAPPAPAPEDEPSAPLPPVHPAPPAPRDYQDLSLEAADLGLDIASLVAEDVVADLPAILEEVFESIELSGAMDADFSAEWRDELAEMRDELRSEFGPEFRIRLTREIEQGRADRELAMAEARREMARARAEMAREIARESIEISRAQAEVARALASSEARGLSLEERDSIRREAQEALEEARREIQAARESGDLDFDFDFDFDLDEVGEDLREEELEGQDHGSLNGPKSVENAREFGLNRALGSERQNGAPLEHAALEPRRASPVPGAAAISSCRQQG